MTPATPVRAIISKAGVRVKCTGCREEIFNKRKIHLDGKMQCKACAGEAYYRHLGAPLPVPQGKAPFAIDEGEG